MHLIGDAHRKRKFFDVYKSIDDSIIQLGDFGLWHTAHYMCDPQKLQVIPGNHEDYDQLFKSDFALGDYGLRNFNGFEFFFIRGGVSIDRTIRISNYIKKVHPKSWWSAEELTYKQMRQCEDEYLSVRPSIVLAHAAPSMFRDKIVGPPKKNDIVRQWGFDLNYEENTSVFLEYLFSLHMPKLFVCGHYHKYTEWSFGGCNFYCLGELEARKVNGFELCL